MDFETWLLFFVLWTSAVLIPGPNAAFSAMMGDRYGRTGAIFAAAGFASTVVVYALVAGLGLLSLLATSQKLFEIFRWIGVLYLFYLGYRMWTAPTSGPVKTVDSQFANKRVFSQAALISLTNPKVALGYLLIYPAFMSGGQAAMQELLILGATSVAVNFTVYGMYGLIGTQFGRIVKNQRQARIRNRLAASVFFGAGTALAFVTRR